MIAKIGNFLGILIVHAGMRIRTMIYVPERLHRDLRRLADRRRFSMAELFWRAAAEVYAGDIRLVRMADADAIKKDRKLLRNLLSRQSLSPALRDELESAACRLELAR